MAVSWADAWPFVLIVLALAAFVVASLLRLKRFRRGGAPPLPPVAVPPEEVELEEGPVTACLRCGSHRVRPANLSEGGIPGGGEGLAWICARCGRRGPAVEFADATAYRQFVKGLNKGSDEPLEEER